MSEEKTGGTALWKFYKYFGRNGSLSGLFVETDANVKEAIGQRVYLGEVLGKHSNVETVLAEDDFKRLTDDPAFIAKFEEFQCSSGLNPLDYLGEDE